MSASAFRRVSDKSSQRVSTQVVKRAFGLGPARQNPILCEHYAYTHFYGLRTSQAWYPLTWHWNFPRDIVWFISLPILYFTVAGLQHWRHGLQIFNPYFQHTRASDMDLAPGKYADFDTNPAERRKWINKHSTAPNTHVPQCAPDYVPGQDSDAADE